MLEQKVWLTTGSQLFPNLYVFIVGHPGVGKTRTIHAARSYLWELEEFHLAPTSLTFAALVDSLVEAKRTVVRIPEGNLEYNSMTIAADELGAFMHKYDDEMISGLSAFYDPHPYAQHRRSREIKIKIKRPQLTILGGSTPSNLLKFMPESAWDQGFTSRVMMVYSSEKIFTDDFATTVKTLDRNLLSDLKVINSLIGEMKVTEEYKRAVNLWRQGGEPPVPTHPKLLHYNTRRRTHLYKLSMISSVDQSDTLILTEQDFERALGWLMEIEHHMPEIFRAGSIGADARAMEEIYHYILTSDIKGYGIPEHKVVAFAKDRLPTYSVLSALELMAKAGQIEAKIIDIKTGDRMWRAKPKSD